MKKYLKLALIIATTILVTTMVVSYYVAKNTRAGFVGATRDVEAFNELHRIKSWDSLEHLLVKGCSKEALEYVKMEQSLGLLFLKDRLDRGAKLGNGLGEENSSILERAKKSINKGKYFVPECY